MLPQISITYRSCGMTASRSANTDGWSETAQSLWTLMASTKHEVRARHVALVTVAIAISCLYTNRPFGVRRRGLTENKHCDLLKLCGAKGV
jgi:hypothetical protein